jgi:hypothetical protein
VLGVSRLRSGAASRARAVQDEAPGVARGQSDPETRQVPHTEARPRPPGPALFGMGALKTRAVPRITRPDLTDAPPEFGRHPQ